MSDVTVPPDTLGPIARYIEALRRGGADPSAEEIADALWLLLQINPREGEVVVLPPEEAREPQPPPRTSKVEAVAQDKRLPEEKESTEHRGPTADGEQPPPGVELLPGTAGDGAGRSGALLKTQQATALPGAPEIARVLRPFRRRVPSRTMQVIDEQATAQRTAEERMLSVVVRPARTRWLAVDLVIDESASMAIWRRTVLAFRRLLVRLGAFRDVRVWGLNADSPSDLPLYTGLPTGKRVDPPHSLNELVDPSGQHLILIVSDCVSPGWHSGAVARTIAGWPGGADVPELAGWGRTNPVALVQMLPQNLWRRTSLGREARVRAWGPLPGVPNAQLDASLDDSMFNEDDEPPPGLVVPVVSLDPLLMRRWARVVAGAAGVTTTGYILNPTGRDLPPVSPIRHLDPRQLLQHFEDHASPEAYELAVLLAAVPVTISVINLVQQEMLPESRQMHAAEVLLSGLLRQTTPLDQMQDPDEIAYEFVDGIRELLLEAAPLVRPVEVIERLSSFIADHLRGEEEMQSRVAGVGGPAVAGGGAQRPFARISPALLRGLGLRIAGGDGQDRPPPVQLPEEPSEKPPPQERRTGTEATQRTSPGVKHRQIYDARRTRELPGMLMRSEGQPPIDDPAVNEAYDGMGTFYDFFWEVFRRHSIDDAGLVLTATVHYERDFNNSFWDMQRSQIILGDGDHRVFNRFTMALDVIASELAQGVIQSESRLNYTNQSGALFNSISDVFGQLVKQHLLKQTADQTDWLVGAGLFTPKVHGVALRSMKAPGTAYDDPMLGKDAQVAHMRNYVRTSSDNGGVHFNSGIPNHAFYLAATQIGGYAWEKAGRIWYESLRGSRLRPNTGFRAFARLTILKAGQLFGQNGLEQQALHEAWSTVGIEISDGRASSSGPPQTASESAIRDRSAEHAGVDTGEDVEPEPDQGSGAEQVTPPPDDVESERSRADAIADIEYRAAQLRDEVTARRQMYREGVWAFSRSQVQALGVLMDDLMRMQDGRLQGLRQELRAEPSADAFAQIYNTVLAQIGATREVLQFFWSLFDRRRDPQLAPQLDAADRVIADCYRTCLDRLSQWGVIGLDTHLAPPMVRIGTGPAITPRGTSVSELIATAMPGDRRLPFQIVTFPSDYAGSMWLYCALHHEVAHAIMTDLRERGAGGTIDQEIAARIGKSTVPLPHAQVWRRWTPEMVADVFGVLLGGAGFGSMIASLLHMTARREKRLNTSEHFPPAYIRIVLIEALLRRCGVRELAGAADWIGQRRRPLPVPESAEEYLAHCDMVAELMLSSRLVALSGHALRDLIPDLEGDARRADGLARYLRTGFQRPDPDNLTPRLVPVAAQIAHTHMEQPDARALATLHARALQYLESIPKPAFL